MNQTPVPKISVVVPVYKVQTYLQECIDSILSQTFTDFELILVNDGSTDNCRAICDVSTNPLIRSVIVPLYLLMNRLRGRQ